METTSGRIKALSVSRQKGTSKANVPEVELKADFGIVGDAHAGSGPRQVSLLTAESIQALCDKGRMVLPGNLGENVTVEGIDLLALGVGCRLRIAGQAELEVTQRGKACHGRCAIFKQVGACIMPRDGVFAKVTRSGRAKVGDVIEVIDGHSSDIDGK
jgi:molybdopterin adenylyltransferase